MKIQLFITFCFFCLFGFSQQKQFQITWDGTKILATSSTRMEVPSFDKDHFSFTEDSGMRFYAQWSVSSPVNKRSLVLNNVSYANISEVELKDIPRSAIPSSPNAILRNAIDRGEKFAYLELSPIIKDNGVYKKITAFTVDFSYGAETASSNFATKRSGTD